MPVDSNRIAATYSAFCRNYGHYTTPAVGSHNWNEEAIEKMIRDLDAPWRKLRLKVQKRHESIVKSIEDLMDWAIDYLGKSTEN